jgi:hypothetical protein
LATVESGKVCRITVTKSSECAVVSVIRPDMVCIFCAVACNSDDATTRRASKVVFMDLKMCMCDYGANVRTHSYIVQNCFSELTFINKGGALSESELARIKELTEWHHFLVLIDTVFNMLPMTELMTVPQFDKLSVTLCDGCCHHIFLIEVGSIGIISCKTG